MNKYQKLEECLIRSGISLSVAALKDLIFFLDELQRWGKRVNLTSILDFDEGMEKHIIDSLLPLPFISDSRSLLDVGSGAGLPGIPLKIARRDLIVYSVDSVGKKIAFQKHIIRHLNLDHFLALNERIEFLPPKQDLQEGFDLVVSRAFSSIPDFLRAAKPHLAVEGRVLAMKSIDALRELKTCARQIDSEGFETQEIYHLKLPISKADRVLIFLRKR